MTGTRPGPRLLIVAGVHGDEYEGSTAIWEFVRSLDPTQLGGTVVAIPVLNAAAWAARSRTNPADGVDLNRVFPGRGGTGPSRALAEVLFDHFITACDALVDLHSGGLRLMHLPMVGWYGGQPEAETLARGFGQPFYPWQMPNVPGVLSYETRRAGKLALGAEWGGGGRLDPVGQAAYVAGLRRLLARLNGQPLDNTLDPRAPIAGAYQTTPRGGLFRPIVQLGDEVEAGAPLGLLTDAWGDGAEQPRAERAGIVAAPAHLPLVDPGDRIAYIG